MENKPKILVVGPRGLFGCEGGIEKFADSFIPRALQYADIDVLCLINPDENLPKGLKAIVVPKSKRFKTDKALYLIYALFLNATRKYDHVFIFGTNFAVLVPFLKMTFWRRPKIMVRSGSIDYLLPKWGPKMKWLMKTTEGFIRYADKVIVVAPSIKHHLENLGIRSELVRNGLDFNTNNSSIDQRQPNSVVAVGRITSQKNYPVLLEASKILGANVPEVTIIGGADMSGEMPRLQQYCSEHNLMNCVKFTGALPRQDVMSILGQKMLYINCSIHEGMSNAVLEAVQQGIPVILSDIEANRDLGLPDAYYFKPDDARGLAMKISDALSNPANYIIPKDQFENWDEAVDRILLITGIK